MAQAAAATAFRTKYHHGEESLVEAIVGLAQDHVGTNNAALLDPLGQFGTRNEPPKIHAAARYIFTRASPVARALFPAADLPVLGMNEEEGTTVEPSYYVPVLPAVLLNGAGGIGTGWSTSVPPFRPEEVAAACERLASGEPLEASVMMPYYEGFTGTVEKTERGWRSTGVFKRVASDRLVFTELPVGRWTECFLKDVRDMASPSDRWPAVTNVWNESSENTVKVTVAFAAGLDEKSDEEVIVRFGLRAAKSDTNMFLFDKTNVLRRYETPHDILQAHAAERLLTYEKRKAHEVVECERLALLARERARRRKGRHEAGVRAGRVGSVASLARARVRGGRSDASLREGGRR